MRMVYDRVTTVSHITIKNSTQISVWVFFSLDKKRIIVYTNSVVNREDYINVVTRIKREIDTLDLWEVY